jgi:hypothetical protein
MRDAGMFGDGAVSRNVSGPVSTNAGNSPGPSVPPGTTHGELNGGRPSGPRAGSPGFRGGISLSHMGAAEDNGPSGGQAAQQVAVMVASQMAAQTAATNETNKLLKIIAGKTATAGDIGNSVATATQTFK